MLYELVKRQEAKLLTFSTLKEQLENQRHLCVFAGPRRPESFVTRAEVSNLLKQ